MQNLNPPASTIAPLPPFKRSAALSLGVELEFGIVDTDSLDLAPGAHLLVPTLARDGFSTRVKAEVTDAMIELNSSVHSTVQTLHEELTELLSTVIAYSKRFGLRLIGGGTHPFQNWTERSIYPSPRFLDVSRTYGYMAKQFTVFGQHVHVGCECGDDAVYLTHALTRYTPHMIALAAASPYWRSVDTGFECCRLNIVDAFPLSGISPSLRTWSQFEDFYLKMARRNVIKSIKDFYWDVRPQPGFGTVEVRVCDTPLQVEDAVDIAAFVQALTAQLLVSTRQWPEEHYNIVYARNRFQARRFGLDGEFIDEGQNRTVTLRESLRAVLQQLEPKFVGLGAKAAHQRLLDRVAIRETSAGWLRRRAQESGDLRVIAREICDGLERAA